MKLWRIMIVVSILGAVMFLSGCATTKNMIGKEFIKETVPNTQTYFSQVSAIEYDNEFKVSGKLNLKGNIGFNIPDFVEVTLIDDGGAVVERQKVAYYPRRLSGKRKHREARFTARFNQAPPSGSIILLSNVN